MSHILINYKPKKENELVGNYEARVKIEEFFKNMRLDNKRRSVFARMITDLKRKGIYINIGNDLKKWISIVNLSIWRRLNDTHKKLFIQKKLLHIGKKPLITTESFRKEKHLFLNEINIIINVIDTLASVKIPTGNCVNSTTLIVYGKECSGKTSAVRVLAEKHGFQIYDYVSETDKQFKNIANLRCKSNTAMTGNILSHFSKSKKKSTPTGISVDNKIISCTLYDDIHNVANGGNTLTSSILKNIHPFHKRRHITNFEKAYSQFCAKTPSICIVSGSKSRSLRELSKSCKTVEFKKLTEREILCILSRIISGEGIPITQSATKKIVEYSTNVPVVSSLRLAVDILVRIKDMYKNLPKITHVQIELALKTQELRTQHKFDSIFDMMDNIIYKFKYRNMCENMRLYSQDSDSICGMLQINYPHIINTIKDKIENKEKGKDLKRRQLIMLNSLNNIAESFDCISIFNNTCYLSANESHNSGSIHSLYGLIIPMTEMIKCSCTTEYEYNSERLPADFPYRINYKHLGTYTISNSFNKLHITSKNTLKRLGPEYINLWLRRIKQQLDTKNIVQKEILTDMLKNKCSPNDLLNISKQTCITTKVTPSFITYLTKMQESYDDCISERIMHN